MSSVEEGGECGAGGDEIRLSLLWMESTRNALSGLLSSGVRAQQNTVCSWQAPMAAWLYELESWRCKY